MTVFTNSSGISIPDASATSQTLQVGSLTGAVTRLSVTIGGLTHLLQDQLDFLLVAPDGTHNLVFWSDVGGPHVVAGANVTVADAGTSPLPESTMVVGGTTYQPADYDFTEAGAMFGSPLVALNHATTNGTATFASAFNTIDPNGIWTLYAADDTVGGTGSITSWSLDFAVGGAMIVDGTSNADTLVINATGPDSGTYVLNGGPAIDLIGVTSFTFNGGDGNDSVTINNPAGGLFGPAGGIFINGGAQTGPPGDSLTLAGGSAGQATFSFGPTPDAGTIASADQEIQRLALGGVGSGSFSLTFNGQTTAQLSAAATAAQVQAALNALSSIGGVGGSVVAVQSGTTFTITFGGTMMATDVPQMTATGTGGTTAGVTTLNDGSAAAQSVTYTGLDPIDHSGSTVTDLVFTLPSSADQAVFDDDGVAANNFSRLRSNNGTFESTVFGHPASSLTLNAGAGDSVAVDFLDPLGTADLTVGGLGNAALRPDSIAIDNVVTTGTVNLGAAGAIAQPGFDGGAPDITASAAAFVAGAGIGTFSQSLDLQVATVAARNIGSGIVNFNNSGPLAIGTVNGLVGITATSDVAINEIGGSAGSLTVASDVHSLAGSVSLRAIGPGSMFTSNAAISAGGNITLAADRMALAGGSASAGGTVRTIFLGPVTPGSAIDLGSQTDAAAGTLELSDAELDTVSTPSLHVGDGITGNITISSSLSGSGHYGSLGLSCLGSIVDATASEQVDLTVPLLTLDAAGIGASDDLDTAVGRLVFFNRGGAVNISNSGPLTLTGGSFNSGTTTTVSTSSPLSLDGAVTSVGDLTLTAGDSAASGDDLTIAVVGGFFTGSTARSTGGNVFLLAGDDFLLNPLASIVAAGLIEITVDAGNADPGVGGTADLRQGTLTGGIAIVVNGQGDGDTLLGSAASENFLGGGGDDLIAGGGGNNALDGGTDNDTADYSAAPGAVVINVATGGTNGYGGTDAFVGIESANGSAFADTLTGDGNANTFKGNGGDDVLVGGAGSDTAAYSGNAADYGLIFLPGTDMRVVDLRAGSPDGTDALSAFEALRFADGTMPIVFGNLVDDDSFTAPPGLQAINARTGNDTITFDFRLVDATVTYSGNGVAIDGPSGRTVLHGFERFVFTDGEVDNNDGDRLVDDLFYYSHNHDVWNAHADADQHYHGFGWHELRDPNAFFSTFLYRAAYPDVSAAGVDPLVHFDQTGWIEGRVPSLAFDPRQYLAAYPDVAAAHVDPLLHYLAFGYQEGREPFAPAELIGANGFDHVSYLNHNPDVAAAHVDPLQHFQIFGWQEGRNPNALFDTAGYLATYSDVAAAHVNPLEHYNQFGWHEGRDPSVNFDTTAYLAAYPDVAAAGVNPLLHFLQFGQHEGRSAFADGTWG